MYKPQELWRIYVVLRIENSYNRKQSKNSFETLKNQKGKSYDFGQSISNSLHYALFSLYESWSNYWRTLQNTKSVAFGIDYLVQAYLIQPSIFNLNAKYNILLWCNTSKYHSFSFHWKWCKSEQCFYEDMSGEGFAHQLFFPTHLSQS